jgi:hypothetical protein
MYKLSPQFLCSYDQDAFNSFVSPAGVLRYSDVAILSKVHVYNPVFPQKSSRYSSPTCKFFSIYAFFSVYRQDNQCKIGSQQSTMGDGLPATIPPMLYFMYHHHPRVPDIPQTVSQLLFSVAGDICCST